MKKIVMSLLVFFTTGLIVSCASNSKKEIEKLGPPMLYTLSNPAERCVGETAIVPVNQEFSIEKLDSALDNLLSGSSGDETLIVYLHGRAAGEEKEPDKSLKYVMPCLERENPVKVLMFFWPGSAEGGILGFPEDQARHAAPGLGKIFADLATYKEANRDRLHNRKIVLLPHSMGNIVFEEFMQSYKSGTLSHHLFDTIILSASASATKDHASWLKDVDFSGHIYVITNNNDPVLDKNGMREIAARLGKKLKTSIAGDVTLAKNATYIDISNTEAHTHRYFLHSNQKGNPYIKQFFEVVLNGKPFDFSGFNGVENTKQRNGTTIYYFRR